MLKWYEKEGKYSDIIISSRIRLARNLRNYPFEVKLDNDRAKNLVAEVINNEKLLQLKDNFQSIKLANLEEICKVSLVERHIASPLLISKQQEVGILLSADESASILVNEEDHLRIQAFSSGMDIEKAYKIANNIDDIAYNQFEYAYSERYGYMTSCPTNLGTGLRASYMLHLPALESANKIQSLVHMLANYGMTIRGMYGEGSKSIGSLYQISNQKTLGQSETEIMSNLNNIVMQIIKQERKRREYSIKNNYNHIEDQIYRSYGVLKYARQISINDAMTLLSQIRLGMVSDILHFDKEVNIYEIMMGIQQGNLQMNANKILTAPEKDRCRASFIRECLP